MCKTKIPRNELYVFKIKVLKAKKSSIFIGVVSKALRKEERNSYKSGNAITYYGAGRIWFGPQLEMKFVETKNDFAEGDEVIVIVDRNRGKIEWKINEKEGGTVENQMLN